MAKPKHRNGQGTLGRPRVEITVDELRALRSLFCTEEEAAAYFRCSVKTLQRRLKDTPELAHAWNDGLQAGKIALRRLQLRHAKGAGSSAVQMTIHMAKHHLGETDKSIAPAGVEGGGSISITGGLPEDQPDNGEPEVPPSPFDKPLELTANDDTKPDGGPKS